MFRTYKRKLILTKAQSERIMSWIGACRVVYNLGLEIRIDTYKKTGRSVHKFELINQLPSLRKEVGWIKDVPAGTLQDCIEKLDRSYQKFFRGAGFPKFASKKIFKSLKIKREISINNNYVTIPKIGKLKIFKDSEIIGTPKNATIKIEPTGIFICIQCDNVPKKFDSESQTIGLDMGISKFCVDSNGGMIDNPKHFQKYERKLRIENRSLSRKKKGSNSWKKQTKRLSLLHHKIGNVRRDFLQKESTKIAKSTSVVYLEDLKVSSMAKNKNLSKRILDCGWGNFRAMLEYKTTVIRVDPKHTSQICFMCGNKDYESRKSQSEFCCTACGHKDNADVNAAKNIKSRGTALVRQREAVACALDLETTCLKARNCVSQLKQEYTE